MKVNHLTQFLIYKGYSKVHYSYDPAFSLYKKGSFTVLLYSENNIWKYKFTSDDKDTMIGLAALGIKVFCEVDKLDYSDLIAL